jgi:CheY-like chemotaxis protein
MRICLRRAEHPHERIDDDVAAPATAPVPYRERRTIVYVDDNLSNLKLIDRVLARFPTVRVIPAMKGRLALELVREHQPDLVLLDLHLPDLHGRQVLQQLKGDPYTAGIPIIVLSADASPAQFERLLCDGATGCLTKPIDVETLLATVRRSVPSLSES